MIDLKTRDYPCVPDVMMMIKVKLGFATDQAKPVDWDEVVYDAISEWDQVFEDCDEWFDEDGSDVKDSLRDQVLEYVDQQGFL